jgi:hypothetical protein
MPACSRVPLDRLQRLMEYWRTGYNWRRFESQINAFPQFRTELDGLGFLFLHVKSKHENALLVSELEWNAAWSRMLVKEKAHSRARDALVAKRRRMPWVEVKNSYDFVCTSSRPMAPCEHRSF